MKKTLDQKIKEYWEDPKSISLIDKNLHQIEIDTVCKHLEKNDYVLDVGCADAHTTVVFAKKVKKIVGLERSDHLRAEGNKLINKMGLKNIRLIPGDVMALPQAKDNNLFDVVICQRLLINLTSWEDQKKAIDNIFKVLKKGGRLILIENTDEGSDNMNKMRRTVGLKAIPKHWHNLYFKHDTLMKYMGRKWKLIKHHDFALYYLFTRIFTSMFASFTGFGINAKKDPIFEVADASARKLYEIYGGQVDLGIKPSLGPIQGFVFKKK